MSAPPAPAFGIVGALAAFPRRLAAREVARIGGALQRGVARATTHVVLGRSLLARPEAALAAVAAAGDRQLLSENAFLRRLGLAPAPAPADLSRAALVEQSGLAPRELDLLALFDAFEHAAEPFAFRDLILARKYAGLIAGGAGWAAIARSVHRCGPAVSLTAKSLHAEGRSVYARHGAALGELDGQLLLDLGAPEDADALFAAAEAAEEADRAAEAAVLYGRCLALDPGDAVAAFNRANCQRAAGRPAEAEQDYLRALRLDPGFVEAYFNLASLVAERGRPAAARAHLEAAIARDPDYADAVYNLASLAFEAGQHAAAARWWRRYLELDPDSDWARTATRGLAFLARQADAG